MTIGPDTSLRQLAFIVCTALGKSGVEAVLTGGGAATIYAPQAYQSHDLDFVLNYYVGTNPKFEQPLQQLGFTGKAGSFRHESTPLTLDFPTGPLAIGEDIITKWSTLEEDGLSLHIITPTDCVRDRLAWFLFNNDYSSLDQALAVAASQEIDLPQARDWAIREGESHKYEVFLTRLAEMTD